MKDLKLPWTFGSRINEDFSESPTGSYQEINTGIHGGAILVVVRMKDDDADLPSGLAAARLIQAAPDGFEALRDMVSDHENLSPATLAFARAVIAKVTGEA
jgi:hypothetical protein